MSSSQSDHDPVSPSSLAFAMLAAALLSLRGGMASSGTDPDNKHAWGGNVGWANAAATNVGQQVEVYFDGHQGWLSGFAWGENIGWIKMGADEGGPYDNTTADNWGVNMAADGALSGYAWGQNIGWINFGHEHCDAAINTANGELSGHAWGENVGWLKLRGSEPDYGVRTLAFDAQTHGSPNWWLDQHGVTEDYDAGDGVPAWKKFVMDTDPKVEGSVLQIEELDYLASESGVRFQPSSSNRYYTLLRRDDLSSGSWSNVPGQTAVPGTGGVQALTDDDAGGQHTYYRIKVAVSP